MAPTARKEPPFPMDANDVLLTIVVVTALAFDFTNGFHDTANAMATSIATGALRPRVAVACSRGAQPASGRSSPWPSPPRSPSGLVDTGDVTLDRGLRRPGRGDPLEPADLVLRVPVELLARAHRRRDRRDAGRRGRHGRGQVGTASCRKVIVPAVLAPVIAGAGRRCSAPGCLPDQPQADGRRPQPTVPDRPDRLGLDGVAGARHQRRAEDDGRHHPGPDRQRHARRPPDTPFWVILSCALAIALGTYLGGWRVIRTLGKGLVRSSRRRAWPPSPPPPRSSCCRPLRLSRCPPPMSPRGDHRRRSRQQGAEVRWNVAGRMAIAWVITLPAAGVVGALRGRPPTPSAERRASPWCSLWR